MNSLLDNINAIQLESPVDKIIGQFRQLIVSGQLKPGDRLPSERALSERLGVGRSYIREALLKMEFYGLLKTNPQSGTYVAGLSIKVLDNIIADIIRFNKNDFNALIEARYHLELTAVKLAAERRTTADLDEIGSALHDYESKIDSGASTAVEEDMIFHVKVAKASKNSIVESMILILVPDLIKSIVSSKICGDNRSLTAVAEHRDILKAIEKQDVELAERSMSAHLDEIWQISKAGYATEKIIKALSN